MSSSSNIFSLKWFVPLFSAFVIFINYSYAANPSTSNFTLSVDEDQTLTISNSDFPFTIGDPDDILANIRVVDLPSKGLLQNSLTNVSAGQLISSAELNAGSFKFIPGQNENGTGYTSFQFTVLDQNGEESGAALLTFDVNPQPDPPTAQNNTLDGVEDTPLTIFDTDFTFNDIDGDSFSKIRIITSVSLGELKNGSTVLSDNDEVPFANLNSGDFTYTPAENGNGDGYASFNFRVFDSSGDNSEIQNIAFDITSVNDVPTSAAKTISIDEDGSKTFSASDFEFNDDDGDLMASIRISALNVTGSLEVNSVEVSNNDIIPATDISSLVFTPLADDFGDDYSSFQFEVNDGLDFSISKYLFTINVTEVDDPPTIDPIADPADIYEDALEQQVTVTGISGGAGEAALDISDISASSSNTTLILNPTVSSYNSGTGEAEISYIPISNQNGQTAITVVIDDGNTTVSDDFVVDVLSVNDEPIINIISNQSTSENTPIVVDIDGISAGAANESGQFLSITAESNDIAIVPDGVVSYNQGDPDGTILFTPVTNAIGSSTITITILDDGGLVNPDDDNEFSFTFDITVLAVNNDPLLADISSPSPIDEDAGQQSIGLTGIDDGDPEASQTLTITAVSDNPDLVETFTSTYTQGSSTATLSYTPKPDAYGSAIVDVTVSDGEKSVTKSFTIVVNPVNDSPTIDPIGTVAEINEDAAMVTIDLSGISPGPNEASQSVTISASSNEQSIIPDPVASYNAGTDTWSISYTPEPNQYGPVLITVTVSDDDTNQKETTTTFTQIVNPVNDPPTMSSIEDIEIDEDSGLQNVVFSGITDDGEIPKNLTVTATSSDETIIQNTSIVINYSSPNSSGSIDFQANPNAFGLSTITVRVTDKDDLFTEQSFIVDVTNINDPPTLNDIPIPSAVLEDAGLQTIVLNGISAGPNENDALVADVSAVEPAFFQQLSVTLNGDGTANLDYWPEANANGTATITVTLDDQLGFDSIIQKSVDISIIEVNDAPNFDIPTVDAISENSGVRSITAFATNIEDGDPEDQSLSFSIALGTPTGNLSFISNPYIDIATGDLSYQAVDGTNGQISVDVTLLDNGGTANGGIDQITKSFSIIVTAVNNPPSFSLNGDPPIINEDDGPITEPIFARDIKDGDPEEEQAMVFDISQASGTLTFSSFPSIDVGSGDLVYTVSSNENGTATFNVTLIETTSGLTSSTAQFTITVNSVNDPPIGENRTITINEDQTYVFNNDDFPISDLDNHAFEGLQITELPLKGDLLYSGSAVALGTSYPDITQLTFTPASNENGTSYTTFMFKVRDESGDLSTDSYKMTINVDVIPDDPTGASASINTEEDTDYTFAVIDFPFSDSDDEAFNGIIIQTNVASGILIEDGSTLSTFPATVNDVTKLVFRPGTGESGTPYADFRFDVVDASNSNSSSDANSPYKMSINVGAVNDPPTGGNGNVVTNEDVTIAFETSNFIFNDPDGHTFAGIQITQIENTGSLKYNGTDVVALTNYSDVSLLTYNPPSNQNGDDLGNFKFRVIDNSGELNISTLEYTMFIDVIAVNDAPVFTITEDPPAINEDAGAQVIVGFATSIDDGDFETDQGLSFGTALISPLTTLSFDVPPKIDPATGNLNYTPSPDTYGTADYNVTLSDNGGTDNGGKDFSEIKQFTITVNPVNDPPSLNDINGPINVNEDANTFTVDLEGITAGPNETQDISVSVSSSDELIIPTPIINYTSANTTGQLQISPIANSNGPATITVTVSDGQSTNSSITKAFDININAVNDPPTLTPITDPDPIDEDAIAQTINLEGISAGPNESQELEITATSDNQSLIPNGSISVNYESPNAIGSISYQPVANQFGKANITVVVKDEGTINNSIPRTFEVEVLSVNDQPTLADLPSSTIEIGEDASAQTLTLQGISAGGNENQTLTISAISDQPGVIPNPTIGSISGGEAILTFQPLSNQSGQDITITVTVDDGQAENNTISKSFKVKVNETNDAPTLDPITGSPFSIDEDASTQTITLQGVSPGGGENQSLDIYAESSDESIIPNPSISYTPGESTAILSYAPMADQSGTITIDVYVDDLQATNNIVSRSFTVNVNEVNDAPTINDIIPPGDILEDASEQTVALSGITAGGSESQTVLVSAAEIGGEDIIDNITVNYSGNNNASLLFTLHPDANGSTTIEVMANDQQSENNITKKSFDINVLKVNDLPTLNPISSPLNINEDAGPQTILLSGISPGTNESEQTVVITAVSDNEALIPNPTIINKTADTKDLIFTPDNDKNGSATITVTANDQQASNNVIARQFVVNVAPINDAPSFDLKTEVNIAENAGPQTEKEVAFNIDDGDPESTQSLTFSLNISGDLSFKTAPTISPANGNLTFEINENINGQSMIDVTLSDNGNPPAASIIKTFSINVLPVNGNPSFTLNGDPPVSIEDAGIVTEPLFAKDINDGDPELDQSATLDFDLNILSGDITFKTLPDIDPSSGELSYEASPNSSGSAFVSVTLSDGENSSSPSYFTLTINPVNDAPTGENETVTTDEDVAYIFKESDFTYNDIESNPFSGIQITSLESIGDLEYNGSDVTINQVCPDINRLTYKPLLNGNGNNYASFSFKLRDSEANLSEPYKMTINVTPKDDNPTSSTAEVNTQENTIYTFSKSDFPFNDPDGDSFNGIRIHSIETRGDLEYQNKDVTAGTFVNNFSQLKFNPLSNENGNPYATFEFEVRDSNGNYSTEYKMSIIVGPVNDRPTGDNENIPLLEDKIYTFSATDFTFKDTDGHTFDGIRIETLETNGDLEYNGNDITNPQTLCPDVSLLRFKPIPNENGNSYASFTFKIKDNSASFNLSDADYTMIIDVTAVNDAPSFTISSNPSVINEDQGIQTVSNFAKSISSGDPEANQVVQFSTPNLVSSTGNLTFNTEPSIGNTGTLTYHANKNTSGTATYSVRLTDNGGTANNGQNQSPSQNFTITVNSVNDAPTINPVSDITINEDASVQSVALSNITAGPLENQTLTVVVESDNEQLIDPDISYSSPNTSGTLTFTPIKDQSGQAVITITVSDNGSSNNTTQESFTVKVNAVNDAPTINQISNQAIAENSGEQIINLAGISAGGGENQAVILSVKSSNTSLIPVPILTYLGGSTAQLAYTPDANKSGESTITITIDDQVGKTTQMTFKVTVSPINDPPTLNPISNPAPIAEDSGEKQILLSGITAGTNENQTLTINVESSNTDLINNFTIDPDFSSNSAILYYTPNSNEFGTSIITVTVDDGALLDHLVSQQFTLNVFPIADTPKVSDASTDQTSQTTSGLIIQRNQNDGAEVKYFKITNIQNGTLFLQDGITEIINGEFISYNQANLGLRFTPGSNLDGSFDIQASLEDANTGLGGDVITANIFINSIPTTTFPIDLLPTDEDSEPMVFYLPQYFEDEEDPAIDLIFTVENTAPEIITANIENQTLKIKLNKDQSGISFITIRCTDSKGAYVEHDLEVNVQPVNDPPEFSSTEITSIEQDVFYEYLVTTIDVENNERDITLITDAGWININDNDDGTAILSGTPSNGDVGDHQIEIVVTESISGLLATQLFNITVTNVNDTPKIVSTPPAVAFIGEKYEYIVEAEDPDLGDSYTIVADLSILPDWLDFMPSSNELVGFPNESDIGTYPIKLIVYDNAGAASEQEFTIEVMIPNTPPTLTGGFVINMIEDSQYQFNVDEFKANFQDPDPNDSLVLVIITISPQLGTLSVNGKTINTNDTIYVNELDQLIYTPDANKNGNDTFSWKATDGKSISINENPVSITIEEVEDPPEIINLEENSIIYEFADYNVSLTELAEVIEADDDQILRAEFSITEGYNDQQDSLAIDVFDDLNANWNDTTGVLTITADFIQNTQLFTDILRSLIYINKKRFAPSIQVRTVEMKVFDGFLYSDAVRRNIEFEDTFVDLVIPTGITPNEDHVNDTWEIEHLQSHEDAIVRIYTREGNKIYESIGFYQPWNGKHNGAYVKTGPYYFTIEIPKFERKYSGTITVLR